MNIKDRINKLEQEIDTKFYKVYFNDNTVEYLTAYQLLILSIDMGRGTNVTVNKVEKPDSEDTSGFLNLCKAIMFVKAR